MHRFPFPSATATTNDLPVRLAHFPVQGGCVWYGPYSLTVLCLRCVKTAKTVRMKTNLIFKWVIIFLGIGIALVAVAVETHAQSHEGFLYGKVHTGRTTYTGPLRWGNEEVLWTDFFNAAKATDNYKKLVPQNKEEEDSWLNFDWNLSSIWEDKVISHQFTCQFGNLVQITPLGRGKAKLKFKNNQEYVINGEGYNDVGAKIQVIDSELGVVNIAWEEITRIEFLPTPARLEAVFGAPLYGTVEGVRREKFSGYIVWDNDERLTTDRLDGDDRDEDLSIKFSEIRSIEKRSKGSQVVLRSGRELYLTGSNDVNSGNRGILVATRDMGVVELPWSAFRSVTFEEPEQKPMTYNEFRAPRMLRGTVSRLEGDDLSGRIIFDIDETLDFEILEGKENDIEYKIPFTLIKRISPKNYEFSQVQLTGGKTLLLGDARDVSSDNGGLLVFQQNKKDPEYISWKRINEIQFN